jgi:hypothetical protein
MSNPESAVPPRPTADFSPELAALLVFTADVAIAIRMNSAYNDARDPRLAPLDVLWLSDLLHNFDVLGRAVQGGDRADISSAVKRLLSQYATYRAPLPGRKSDPVETFKRYEHRFQLEEAQAALRAIRAKAQTQEAS